ncbi:MAG: carbohydrate kinase family protein [Anaerolineae bacterium]|nr:carbohydrate kinase family protein [Anaerolineae bacterium]
MKIVITGSIAYDYLMSFPGKFADNILADQIHRISVSFLVKEMKKYRGGVAPNIAYTMALLGSRPRILATAGTDFAEYRAWLEARGVDTSLIIEIENEFCASFFCTTDASQNQIASFYTGAMAYAGQLSFAQYAPDTQLTIISPNDPGAMRAYVQECKQLGIPYIYDPSQQTIWATPEELCEGLDGARFLSVNEYEFNLIQEKTGLTGPEIRQRTQGILLTKGANGAEVMVNGDVYEIPAILPIQVVDPTGAGDAFRAGFMRGLELKLPWEICGRVGALAATYALEQAGTQNHYYTPAQFTARYRKHFDDDGALDVLSTD